MEAIESRRWFPFRYSLRTLFIVVTVVCVVSGAWFNKAFRQRHAVRQFNQLAVNPWETTVIYRHTDGGSVTSPQIPAGLYPLSRVIGEEAFGEVIEVDLTLTRASDNDLKYLADVPTVERLSLSNTRVTDKGLACIRGCPRLKSLALNSVQITDDGLTHLTSLTELEALGLVGTRVTDDGVGHLMRLEKLRFLSLQDTAISDDGYRKLQAALPQCSIVASVPAFYEKHGLREYLVHIELSASLPESPVADPLSYPGGQLYLLDSLAMLPPVQPHYHHSSQCARYSASAAPRTTSRGADLRPPAHGRRRPARRSPPGGSSRR